ncbi:unnamed protein product [Calypogeia fissa]
MGKQGAELRWWDQSSSTVLLDPAALVESCKQQIQGKDGIPAEHQRLIFACRVANQDVLSYTCKRSSRCPGAEENAVFLKELGAWEAILKDDHHNIAKLLHPLVRAEEQVAAEDERKASQLSCQTARELRSMGIPCNVYYLFFDKWIPASLKTGKCCKPMSNVEIQIDKDFQAKSFQILLFGRLNGSNLPLPFVYRMNGGEVAAQLSMLEQVAQYRQGQKTRHRLGLSTQSVGKGVEGREGHAVADNDDPSNGCDKSELVDDYFCPCGKGLDFTVTISKDHKLKCFVLKVIQVPATKPEQIVSHVPMRCERRNSNAQHDSNKFCVSSSGVASLKCESAVPQNKAAFAESLSTKCCQFANKSSQHEGESLGSCPLELPGPSESSQSSTSESGLGPQNVSHSTTDNGPEGLPISEEPLGKLSKKKKKKKKGKRNGKVTTEACSSLTSQPSDLTPAVSPIDGCLDSCTQPAIIEGSRRCCETTCSSGCIDGGTDARKQESPLTEDTERELSTSGERGEEGLVNIFCREVHCVENSTGNCCGSMMRAAAMKIGQGYVTAEEIIAEIVSDKMSIALSKESSKDNVGTGLTHGEEFLPVGRDIPWSARLGTGSCELSAEFRDPHALSANVDHAYMCTSTCLSNNLGVSQPFVGPIMVEMGFQKSSPSARSPSDSIVSHYPSRGLAGNLQRDSDVKDDVDFSDARFSARGGYNGSGTGSRNGRSGADGSGNRSHGRGSEDRKGTSGYHGGGQGSSSSNHAGGPGGSSTSGGSGGSGGGNGNRGGGRGSSGGSWDGRRSDDDSANGSKEGDNDERYRNSFQAGSNGEASADSVSRKKGVSGLDNRINHGRKGLSGAGDPHMNGTMSNHVSPAASNSGSKENLNSWQKVQKPLSDDPDCFTEDSVPTSQSTIGSEEGTPRTRMDQRFGPSSAYMNGFVQHEVPPTKESNENSKDIRNSGTLSGQDSLKGAWQKKISWDDQRQSSFNKYVPEGSAYVGPSKGKLYVKPIRNGIQQMRGHSPDSDVGSYTRSLSAPSTPNGSQDDFTDSGEFSKNYSTKPSDGHIYQSAGQTVTVAREQVPQARMQLVHTVVVRQPGEARSVPDEYLQRSTTSKSRRPNNDQERPLVREKILGDRERTTHFAQKWVPVEHKSGGSVKGPGIQSNSAGNVRTGVPADGNVTQSHESQQDFVNSTEIISRQEDSRKDEGPSSSLSEIPASTSPSKSLRRLPTFPFGNMSTMLRVSTSEAEEFRELATERSSGHPEQANLRGLLPRERILDNPPTQLASRSDADGYSISVQSPITREQKSDLRIDDRGSKGGTDVVKPVLSPAEEETRRVARAILDAVQSSCRDRRAAELIVREVGCPMAEFEKVLGAVAPSFFPSSQTCEEDDFSICRCRVSHIPLNSIWQWYEEPSNCGVEVRAVDSQKVQQNGEEEEPFLAYFVPYISGLQIFGYSSDRGSRSSGEVGSTKGNMDNPLSCQRSDMLATLFPTPGKSDESSSHARLACTTCGQKDRSFRDQDTRGIHLLYEFYDADVPQVRQPLFIKMKELVGGVSSFNSHSKGDPAVLDRLCLGDVHPASWFAVAWYPIYRISEGPLRAVFLTYHSFNHFAPQRSLSCLMGGVTDVDGSISMPVVGLECYNLQGEPWLSMGARFSKEATKVSERLPVNPTQCLENRISSLQEVAAGMAKGIPDNKSGSADGSNKFRHSDYEFFVKRRR